MGFLKNIFRAVVTTYIVREVSKKFADNFWHYIKFDVPLENIKVSFPSISTCLITLDFIVHNNFSLAIPISQIAATVYYPTADGLVELANTPPNNREYIINSKEVTTIRDIQVKIITWSSIGAIKSMLSQPKGKRFKITITGKVKGLPFSNDVWY